jgi:hypothetical protein
MRLLPDDPWDEELGNSELRLQKTLLHDTSKSKREESIDYMSKSSLTNQATFIPKPSNTTFFEIVKVSEYKSLHVLTSVTSPLPSKRAQGWRTM